MKGITYLIIASVVWSIVSGIIEKRKAAAKKEAAKVNLSRQPTQPMQSPVSVKVQSLRRKRQPAPTPPPTPAPERDRKPIPGLHKEECPLPPQQSTPTAPRPAKQIAGLLGNRRNIRTAIVLSDILNKPVSQR
jgi:hypothetical protein